MTKINLTKAALLAATALLGATSAHAQVADSWDIGSDVSVTGTNTGGDVKLDASAAGIQGANIADGYKNSISNAAVGSSASSSFTTFNNTGSTSTSADVTYEGGITVQSGNDGGVTNLSDLADSVAIDKATASNGNSISIAAVGSSASVSATVTAGNGSTIDNAAYSVGGDVNVVNGDGTTLGLADLTSGGNLGDVTVNLTTGMAAPTISDGNANSISVAGVGASSSFSLTNNTVNADSNIAAEAMDVGGAINVSATNEGGISVSGADTATNATIDTADIAAGTGNSISTAGVGSSASVSYANNTYDTAAGSAAAEFSVGDTTTISSLNEGGVTVLADLTTSANIDAGNDNSISVAGVGSSGSLSVTNAIYDGSAGPATVGVTFADISVTSLSAGDTTVTGSITDSAAIGGGANNSISIAGVGASASASFTTTAYGETGDGASATTGATGGITLVATMNGGTTVTTGINTPAIAGGWNNSISAAAVGASASQSVTQNVLGAGL